MPEKEQNQNGPKRLVFYVKLMSAILALFIAVGGIIWGMTSTFAMKPEVKAVKVTIEREIELVAQKSVETFNMFQRSYQNEQKRGAIQYYNQQIEESHRRERYIREDLQKQPNNQCLKNRLQDELRLQDFYRQKRDSLLSR